MRLLSFLDRAESTATPLWPPVAAFPAVASRTDRAGAWDAGRRSPATSWPQRVAEPQNALLGRRHRPTSQPASRRDQASRHPGPVRAQGVRYGPGPSLVAAVT